MTNKNKTLYEEFLQNFPNFKTIVKNVEPAGKQSIRINCTTGKSFIFKKTTDGISLSRCV